MFNALYNLICCWKVLRRRRHTDRPSEQKPGFKAATKTSYFYDTKCQTSSINWRSLFTQPDPCWTLEHNQGYIKYLITGLKKEKCFALLCPQRVDERYTMKMIYDVGRPAVIIVSEHPELLLVLHTHRLPP